MGVQEFKVTIDNAGDEVDVEDLCFILANNLGSYNVNWTFDIVETTGCSEGD